MKKGSSLSCGEWVRSLGFQALDRLRGPGVIAEVRNVADYYAKPEQQHAFRQSRLTELLDRVVEDVPFYRHLKGYSSLQDFPVVDKNVLRNERERLFADSCDREKLGRVTTSGSSGQPFECFHGPVKRVRKLADLLYFNSEAGYRLGMRHMLIRATAKGRLQQFIQNQIWIDPTAWNEEFKQMMRIRLRRDRVKVAIGYPSVMADLAEYCLKSGDHANGYSLTLFIATSELITAQQRDKIREAFGCRVVSRYATEEFGVIGQSDDDCAAFSISSSSVVVELLALDADMPVVAGEIGRVVVTDMSLWEMPLIRYDIGDLAVADSAGDPVLGVDRIRSLEGKNTQLITDSKGERVAPLSILVAFKEFKGVEQFQFAQLGPKNYQLRVCPERALVSDGVLAALKRILGADAKIDIRMQREITALPSGKRPVVVNES